MGDIKRFRKKYSTPMHPWNATRILLEKEIRSKYGTGNKKEIWKMESVLKDFKGQAKKLLTRTDTQANKEREQMRERMTRLGLIKMGAGVDDILSLQLRDVMNRRLQTIVYKRKMARTISHARQLITHEHVLVGGQKITSPSYLVLADEESTISFAPDSAYLQSEHPEGFNEEIAQRTQARRRAKDKRRGFETTELIAFDVKAIADPEELARATASADASVADLAVDEKKE
jgi:small subunit ribosomal protein S4